jgi:hypothetical protein
MTAWFVGAKTNDLVYPAQDAMKKDPAECDDCGRDAWVSFLKSEGRWNEVVCAALPIDAIWFDGGGCIAQDEPLVKWEANGCHMKTYVRHLPFTLDVFRGLKVRDAKLPGCVGFTGFCRVYVLSDKTRLESVEVMESLLKGTESLRQELELDQQKLFNGMSHGFSARKCGCLSGKMYVECCGKFIESKEHKKTREALS